jgi:hypothetical protein
MAPARNGIYLLLSQITISSEPLKAGDVNMAKHRHTYKFYKYFCLRTWLELETLRLCMVILL